MSPFAPHRIPLTVLLKQGFRGGLIAGACFFPTIGDVAFGEDAVAVREQDETNAAPLKRLVMFTSGVGYFEHEGTVEGNAGVNLKFKVEDINDLLKSMIVEDLDGGRVSTVTYASRDPLDKTLKTFSIDLTRQPTLGQLLAQIRGEKIEAQRMSDAQTLSGAIVSLEKKKIRVGKDETIEAEVLTLLTDRGLVNVPLDELGVIKLANPTLDAELRQVLALLATSHSQDTKPVQLQFLGEGRRQIRIGYIQETPIWKTSYRLALNKDEAHIQGWAVVENASDRDWKNIEMELISGRPISFRMDLYQPLYVQRPMMQLELYASATSQLYGANLNQEMDKNGLPVGSFGNVTLPGNSPLPPMAPAPKGAARFGGGRGPAESQFVAEDAPGDRDSLRRKSGLAALNPSVQSGDVGELFSYRIKTPVTLARQQSAMLPLLDQKIDAKKVSIYSAADQGKHPRHGLQLKNNTALHLMQGPITIYDDDTYAGDARILDLAPGAERLIDYALDLDVEIAIDPATQKDGSTIIQATLSEGVLHLQRKLVRHFDYKIKNSSAKPRTILIERPSQTGWSLVKPEKPFEETRDLYRLKVDVAANSTQVLPIDEQMVQHEAVMIRDLDIHRAGIYIAATDIRPEVKAFLGEVQKRLQTLESFKRQLAEKQGQIDAISNEQNRIRQNMERLDKTSELYRRYESKLGTQETDIEKLRKSIDDLTTSRNNAQQELNDFIGRARF